VVAELHGLRFVAGTRCWSEMLRSRECDSANGPPNVVNMRERNSRGAIFFSRLAAPKFAGSPRGRRRRGRDPRRLAARGVVSRPPRHRGSADDYLLGVQEIKILKTKLITAHDVARTN
jgi:hypothetical protein